MDNWLEIIVAVYLIGMVLYGHHRGFIRLVVSIAALVITILVVNAITPQISKLFVNNQQIQNIIKEQIQENMDINYMTETDLENVSFQRMAIEDLNIPQVMKDVLLENNNIEMYDILGVDHFIDYVVGIMIRMVLNAIGFIITFIIVYIAIKMVLKWINVITKLPVLNGINQIAGAAAGLVEGLLVLWFVLLVISIFSETAGGQILVGQIQKSVWLSYFYNSNMLTRMVFTSIKRMI